MDKRKPTERLLKAIFTHKVVVDGLGQYTVYSFKTNKVTDSCFIGDQGEELFDADWKASMIIADDDNHAHTRAIDLVKKHKDSGE